jgi:membrane protein
VLIMGKKAWVLLRAGIDLALRGRITGLAAEIAFWGVLSLIPMALVLAALLGALEPLIGADGVVRARDEAVSAVDRVFPGSGGGVASAVTDLFTQPRTGLLSFALVLTVWTSGRVFAAVANAFGSIIGGRDHRPWLVRRLLGVGLGVGTLVVVAGLLTVIVIDPFGLPRWATLLLSVAVLMLWVTTVFHFAPGHAMPWRYNVPGAVLASVSWGVVTLGFRIYIDVQQGNPVVVGLGGVLVTLLWFYLMSFGLLRSEERR